MSQTPQTEDPPGEALRLRLLGSFALERPDGSAVRIGHRRNRALLALLATAPGRTRTRSWLKARLWSERDEGQASVSLRTALATLRRDLGPWRDALDVESDREAVRLSPALVRADLDTQPAAPGEPELLEGFDLREEAFEDWLRLARAAREAAARSRAPGPSDDPAEARDDASPWPGPTLFSIAEGGDDPAEAWLAQAVLDEVDRHLGEALGRGIDGVLRPDAALPHGLVLRASVVREGAVARLGLRLEHPGSRRRVWSDRVAAPVGDVDLLGRAELQRLAHGGFAAVLDALPRIETPTGRGDPHALMCRAITEMFSFDPAKLRLADSLMAAATDLGAPPSALAWRSLLCQFMVAERCAEDPELLRARSEALAEEAVRLAQGNPQVLAIVSVVRQLLEEEPWEGEALARRALRANPGAPMAHVGLAIAHLRRGEAERALELIGTARAIAAGSPIAHWVEMFRCLAAIACERWEEAVESASDSASMTPHFRPPLRHLYALHLQAGNHGMAKRVLERLRRMEPDFSLEGIRRDPSYPASTLRSSGLIELDDVKG